ncbi:MAG: hypothetical protein GC160_04770 [Acidobacteria bacterium]|nr:hypothetical protein [Acidobacteriota bacterium]
MAFQNHPFHLFSVSSRANVAKCRDSFFCGPGDVAGFSIPGYGRRQVAYARAVPKPAIPPDLVIRRGISWRASRFQSVAWSPDGGRLAAGGADGCIWLWDALESPPRLMEGHQDRVRSVVWSPDGRRLASAGDDRTVRLWDPDGGFPLGTLGGHQDAVLSVAWSLDGRLLASGGRDGVVRLWRSHNATFSSDLAAGQDGLLSVAWSPDSRCLASAGKDNTIRLWDPDSGSALRILGGHQDWVRSVVWSPDGRLLASAGYDSTVRLWAPDSSLALRTLEGHQQRVLSVAWSADGRRLASAGKDGTVRVWDLDSGSALRTLEGHQGWVRGVAWNPDNRRLVSTGEDSTVRVWDADSGSPLRTLMGHQHWTLSAAWSPDGHHLASAGYDGGVRLLDPESGSDLRTLEGHLNWVLSVAWSPDGRRLASAGEDSSVRLWDPNSGSALRTLAGHQHGAAGVAWSADGRRLASGGEDRSIRLWDPDSGAVLQTLVGHLNWVLSVAWSPDGRHLASAGYDGIVRLWDLDSGSSLFTLEGHSDSVRQLAFSEDNRYLVAVQSDCAARLWRLEDGALVAECDSLPFRNWPCEVGWGPAPRAILLGGALQFLEWRPGAAAAAPRKSIVSTTAKVALTGDSKAGKSCLALRLAEDRYEERGSTHGMQIWTLPAEKLDPTARAPDGELREIFLWDLGGQDEYKLVHQLFLHDTTVALTLFDPDRGGVGLSSAAEWSRRLEQQLRGGVLKKLLVRSKLDEPTVAPDASAVEALRGEHRFHRYLEVSARDPQLGDGIDELRRELSALIDWARLGRVSRDAVFQAIRDQIQARRQAEAIVYYRRDLESDLRAAGVEADRKQIQMVIDQLRPQGQLVDATVDSGDEVLVLRTDVVSRYASSLVKAVKEQKNRSVPAMELRRVLSPEMEFPGLRADDRAARADERIVLECVVGLMLRRGLCLNHAGLLVFPSLYPEPAGEEPEKPPHRVPLYYEMTGAVENLYAGLVAWLDYAREFGRVRLWPDRAEYEQAEQGVFGVLRQRKLGGRGRLDLYFSDKTDEERRLRFREAVEAYFAEEGVKVRPGDIFRCPCGDWQLDEGEVQKVLDKGHDSVLCPFCQERSDLLLAKGSVGHADATQAIRYEVERRKDREVREAKRTMARETPPVDEPIRILHLSDLHLTGEQGRNEMFQPLSADLCEMKAERIEYLVVSGDLADRCSPKGLQAAQELIIQVIEEFGISAERLVMIPGNHDYDQEVEVYQMSREKPKGGRYSQEGRIYLVEDAPKYPTRFEPFRKIFKTITQRDYPLSHDEQATVQFFPETGIEFLSLNSAWEVDRDHRERITLNMEALSRGLLASAKNHAGLRIVVWHHAVTGDRKVANPEAIERLTKAGYRLCLHGDVHEDRADLLCHYDQDRRFYVAGAGSFGSAAEGRPESTPRLYNLLEVDRGLKKIRVRTRAQKKAGGAFDEHAVWPNPEGKGKLGEYWIEL